MAVIWDNMTSRGLLGVMALVATVFVLVACSGKMASPSTPVRVAGTATPSSTWSMSPTSLPAAPVLPTAGPISTTEESVWRSVAASTAGNITPLIRPPSLPPGFQTVVSLALPNKPDPYLFGVEYAGPGEKLRISAGPLNPPPPEANGHQEAVTVRGQEGVLNVNDDADPSSRVWIWWNEPGHELVGEGAQPRDEVFYYVMSEGLTAAELLAVTESLQPWTP